MSEQQLPEQPSPDQKAIEALTQALKSELHKQQDPVYAVIGGLTAALVGAVIWAVITVSTKYQIGYMAIGVGLLVAFSVRYFGGGIDKYFGFIGAFFALLGCALGNLLSQVGFIADAESLGYFETITLLNLDLIIEIFVQSFSPMDVVFYAIAAYEGFKFSCRNLDVELATAVAAGKVLPPANARFRLPVVIVLFVGMSVLGYVVSKGSEGVRTFTYESGNKRAMGSMSTGKENGAWEFWWENGNPQSQGYYLDGKQDSVWTYFNEEGVMFQKLTYKNGVENGTYTEYFGDGTVSATGTYKDGRKSGPSQAFYETGTTSAQGSYVLDLPDGPWEYYYGNGNASSKGSYKMGIAQGPWTYWYEDGKKDQEVNQVDETEVRILNAWSESGKQVIVNGEGTYSVYFADGQLQESGKIHEGRKTGKWTTYYEDGSKHMEGEYNAGVYYMTNAWARDGEQLVKGGEGDYELTLADGSISEAGLIQGGLRFGEWASYYYGSKAIFMEYNYVGGKLDGEHRTYFEDGTVNVEGTMSKDKRVGEWKWYMQDGVVESSVTFVDGKKEGNQYFFDTAGELKRTEVYSKGELLDTKMGE